MIARSKAVDQLISRQALTLSDKSIGAVGKKYIVSLPTITRCKVETLQAGGFAIVPFENQTISVSLKPANDSRGDTARPAPVPDFSS